MQNFCRFWRLSGPRLELVSDHFGTSRCVVAGTMHAYHGVTMGMYANELVKRVDPKRRTLWKFFEEEFAKPLGRRLLLVFVTATLLRVSVL